MLYPRTTLYTFPFRQGPHLNTCKKGGPNVQSWVRDRKGNVPPLPPSPPVCVWNTARSEGWFGHDNHVTRALHIGPRICMYLSRQGPIGTRPGPWHFSARSCTPPYADIMALRLTRFPQPGPRFLSCPRPSASRRAIPPFLYMLHVISVGDQRSLCVFVCAAWTSNPAAPGICVESKESPPLFGQRCAHSLPDG